MVENRTPQDSDFNSSKNLSQNIKIIEFFAFIASVLQMSFNWISAKPYLVGSIVFIIIIFVMNINREKKFSDASEKRMKGLLDDAFNVNRFPEKLEIKYYDNDEIEFGIIRLLANVHENSFFTKEIASKMKKKAIRLVAIILIIFIIFFSIDGATETTNIFISVIFSSSFFIDTLGIYNLSKETENIYRECNQLCVNYEENKIQGHTLYSMIIEILIKYENTLISTQVDLDSDLFNEMNNDLTNQWEKIKQEYSIYREWKNDNHMINDFLAIFNVYRSLIHVDNTYDYSVAGFMDKSFKIEFNCLHLF